MAFGFDDFAKFFDPISDVLGTSGRKGVGLLQQKPEDIAMTAAAMYLAANGVPVSPETLAAAEPLAAAGESAALVTPEVAAMAPSQVAAMTPGTSGIMEVGQLDPALVESINAPGIKTAGLGNLLETGYWETPVNLDPLTVSDYNALNVEPKWAQEAAKANLNDVNGLDWSSQIGYEQATSPALQDYQTTQFQNELAARSAAAPPSNIQQFENPASTTQNMFRGNPAEAGFQPPQVTKGGYFNNGITGEYTDTLSPFERGMDTAGRYFDKASKWAKDNPYPAAGLAYYTAYKTGMLDQPKQEPIADNYKNPYSMANFQRSSPNPSAYQYRPRYPQYAQGGIASVHGYAKGGRSKAEMAMDFYNAMNPQQESAPLRHGDPGIYYDMDPDTRYLDPMEAAMVRMSKLNSRTNVQAPTMAPSRRMGELDFKPVAAARGGIMGYASGGDVPIEEDEFNRLTGRSNGGGRKTPEVGVTFSPTSEGAAAVSRFGQRMNNYPGWAPLSLGAKVVGAIASSYGEHMAKNVDPNYSHEGRNAAPPASVGGNGGASSDGPVGRGPGGQDSAGEHGASLAQGGGIAGYNLGGYAAGGNPRLLRGPGDGMSDNIPATINYRQPARLADGEFVVPADVVSHLGNGSTEAGAKQLHAMMTKVRKDRTGNPKQGKQINPRKYLPA